MPSLLQVKWFERRTKLEPELSGLVDKEREVVELEDVDTNAIGCISGKCTVLKSSSYSAVSGGTGLLAIPG